MLGGKGRDRGELDELGRSGACLLLRPCSE